MNRIQKYTIPTTPNAIHGFIFDLAVLAGNIIFAMSILDQTEDLPDRTVGLLMALAIVAQLFGAILKSSPLKQRLWKKPSRSGKGILDKFMDVLLFFHFILFSVVCLLAMDLLGIVNLVDRSASGEDLWVVISLVIAAILTFSVWRAGKRPGESLPETAQHSILQEALADGLLLISVSIGFSPRAIVLLVGLSLLFVVFYLPSRYLFLVEDYRYLRTWVRMWVAMLPIAWLVLVG